MGSGFRVQGAATGQCYGIMLCDRFRSGDGNSFSLSSVPQEQKAGVEKPSPQSGGPRC